VVQIPTADERNWLTDEKIIILSPFDFKLFLAHKSIFSYKSEEIIHDPTLTVSEPPAEQFNPVDPHDAPPPKAKRESYFGSAKWRADMEAKKQLKKAKK
jgi:hypothetical protein